MTEQYGGFAYLYDRLMEDVDYKGWADYVEQIIKVNVKQCESVLELGCGTGNITIPMAKKEYNIVGLDISEDMLIVANNKALEEGLKIPFIHENMAYLQIEKKFDCVLSMCDGINYIVDEEDLTKVFHGVYNILNDEGIFIFDISSAYKLETILGNNTYGENLGDICYLWENYYNSENSTIEMDLTFFVQDGKYYKKEEEFHLQKAYKIEEVEKVLKATGFKRIKVYDAFTFNTPHNKSERIFFVVKK